jgi:hypothetical protein
MVESFKVATVDSETVTFVGLAKAFLGKRTPELVLATRSHVAQVLDITALFVCVFMCVPWMCVY